MNNIQAFFDSVRKNIFAGHLTTSQVDGMEAVADHWKASGLTDQRWLAYMFGTMFRETAATMQPIEEYGKGKGRPYGSKIKRSGLTYVIPNQIYYGRGLVQITWYENYELMGRLLSVDLLNHPELALTTDVATRVMFEGMTKGSSSFGDFTGRCLEQYFNASTEDWINARKIINGLDHAQEIADNSKLFYAAIKEAA